MTKRERFLHYCEFYSYGKPRDIPAPKRTIDRYARGLNLVQKIVGHDLEQVSDQDQLVFISGIMRYAQGTRRVSTQIFQRYIAWGLKHRELSCNNLIFGKEAKIIGANTPPSYTYIGRDRTKRFFEVIVDDALATSLFGLIYYCGLTPMELSKLTLSSITEDHNLIVFREVRKESQVVALPVRLHKALGRYTSTQEGPGLFPSIYQKEESAVRGWLTSQFRITTTRHDILVGMNLRDFRTSAIRHFFERSNSVELTKEFAGVPDTKKGWLEDIIDPNYYYRKDATKVRRKT